MIINEWEETPIPSHIKIYSVNGVQWPLDAYLQSIGELTTDDLVYKLTGFYDKWGVY